jgi:hypothetical protein
MVTWCDDLQSFRQCSRQPMYISNVLQKRGVSKQYSVNMCATTRQCSPQPLQPAPVLLLMLMLCISDVLHSMSALHAVQAVNIYTSDSDGWSGKWAMWHRCQLSSMYEIAMFFCTVKSSPVGLRKPMTLCYWCACRCV